MAESANDVRSSFDGSELAIRTAYDRILLELDRVGVFTEELREDTIHLAHSVAFASVHPHQSHLILALRLDHSVDGIRVHRSEQVSANRWHVEFKLTDPTEVDGELRDLLVEAMGLV